MRSRDTLGEVRERRSSEPCSDATGQEAPEELESGRHVVVQEIQTGVSCKKLFADYLKAARRVEIVAPYIRRYYQVRNVLEFCNMLLDILPEGEEVEVTLLTGAASDEVDEQEEDLENLKDSLRGSGIHFD